MFKYINTNLLGYLVIVVTAAIAIITLIKDWKNYEKHWVRASMIILTGALAIIGVSNKYYTDENANSKISSLNNSVNNLNTILRHNTETFVNAFDNLFRELSDLRVKVTNKELQKKADLLSAKLESTQKALITPKATLAFTFPKQNNDAPIIRTVTLPVKDNVVHVEFTVQNTTDVPAIDGDLTIGIGASCRFASEPPLFHKSSGLKDTERIMRFDRILPKTIMPPMSADIIVPPSFDVIGFGITYRCRTCIIPQPNENMGKIVLSR